MKTTKPAVSTLGELKVSGWKSISIRDEIRKNLIAKIKKMNLLLKVFLDMTKQLFPKFNMRYFQDMI